MRPRRLIIANSRYFEKSSVTHPSVCTPLAEKAPPAGDGVVRVAGILFSDRPVPVLAQPALLSDLEAQPSAAGSHSPG